MKSRIVILIFNLLFISLGIGLAGEPNDSAQINETIEKLNIATTNLKNLSAKIEYVHVQSLFDTQTVRSGRLFYLKDANSSALRINFLTMKQDDANEQNYREYYIFDGMKLTKIDYQSKSVTTEHLGKDTPIEPLELAQDYFPIIGFVKPSELNRQFDIKAGPKQDKQGFVTLILTPKENCRFFKIYKQVEIKIDSENFLPFDFWGLTFEDEKISIKLSQMDISTQVKMSIFDIVIPADFTQTQKERN